MVLALLAVSASASPLTLSETLSIGKTPPPPVPHAAIAPTIPDATGISELIDPVIKLGVGDTVSIEVYGKPELKTTTYVADDGTVLMPLAGPVAIAGLSPAAASAKITAALKDGEFLVNPQVSITVTTSRSRQVSVLGQVKNEGRFAYESNSTVFDLLALAGGRKDEGATVIYLLRSDSSGTVTRTPINLDSLGDPGLDFPQIKFQTGDTLFVPKIGKFYIQGEVTTPNQYLLEPGMTVTEAIARAGGVTRRGSASRVEIKRKQPNGSFKTISPKPTDPVMADDVVRVKESIF